MDLGEIFESNFDCYADTWQEEKGKMIEGDVVLAMTKAKFLEVVKNFGLTAVSCPNPDCKSKNIKNKEDYSYCEDCRRRFKGQHCN